MSDRTTPNEQRKIVEKYLREKCGAWLMGGAVRDALLRKPIKDRDYYVGYSGRRVDDIRDFLDHGGVVYEITHMSSTDTAYIHNYLWSRIEVDSIGIDILMFDPEKTHREILDAFDVGLCMVALTDKMDLLRTSKFNKDVHNKTITVYRNGWGETGVEAHVARMLLKYPDYTVVREDEDVLRI